MPVCSLRDGATLSYADQGAGAAIVLVHGWAANGAFFRDLATRLSKTHRVLTPTLRAHPGSDAGAAPLTIETLADDIADFADALQLTSFAALGWSMGAMALWTASTRLGPRLNAIIVEDMGPCLISDAAWTHGLAGYGAADIAGTLNDITSDWPAHVARFASRMFAPNARDARPELVDWVTAEMSKANGPAMAAYWKSMVEQDFRAALARITQPMLVIRGAESQVYPDGATAHIARTAPHAERVSIQGAGHVPHLEAPDQFFTNVDAFVRGERRSELRSGGAVQ